MRVYGSSPLFNYVELVFRSKRLFIVSIILASLATTGFYMFRAKSYSARMLVILTGSQVVGAQEDTERGTIKFKLDVLNALVRNPNFIKQAMRPLAVGKNEFEFAEFCKRVSGALSYSSDGGSLLEISCHWEDASCAAIVKAFYSEYARNVLDQETILTTTRKQLLGDLVEEYRNKQHDLDKKVKAYQLHSLHNPAQSFEEANHEWVQLNNEVGRLQGQLNGAQKQRGFIAAALQSTKPTIDDQTVYLGPGASPDFNNATQAKEDAEKKLNELKLHKTDMHPDVRAAQKVYDDASAKVADLSKAATTAPKKGPAVQIRVNNNPQYVSLKTQLTDQDLAITNLQSSLQSTIAARDAVDVKARVAPEEALKFKYMTEDMGLYAGLHSSLRGDLEGARLNEIREEKLKAKEMQTVLDPEAEPEKGGSRGATMLAAGPLLGLLIAFCFSLLAESMDHSLRTPTEVEKYLGKPVLAVLPRMDIHKKSNRRQLERGDNNRPSLPS